MLLSYILAGFCLVIFFLMLINYLSPKSTWFCKTFGWHIAPKKQGFDGCSKKGICPRCKKDVLQDGQGNWF